MSQSRLVLLKQMADGIAAEFGPNCEVVVHDLSRRHVNNSIIYIVNGNISGRQVGDGASRAVLRALKKGAELTDSYAYLTRTDSGRIMKSSTMYIKDDDGNPKYALGINFDITNLVAFEGTIKALTGSVHDSSDSDTSKSDRIPKDVNTLLDELIQQSVELVGVPVAFMTKEDKIKAINFLNDTGAFLITKSGDKVSKFFGISKYTLYSYVNINK